MNTVLILLAAFVAALLLASLLLPAQLSALLIAALRRHAGLKLRRAEIPGFALRYLEGGAGEPLLLLHGIGADKDNFVPIARLLCRHYRVIIPDLPGFGDSDKPQEASYRLHDQVRNLMAFADALGIKTFHLGGNSMGGSIAASAAAAQPQRVTSLWLLAPGGVRSAKKTALFEKIEAGEPVPIFARTVPELKSLLAFATFKPPFLPGFVLKTLAAQQRAGYALNNHILLQILEGPWLEDALAARPATPTLIVWGDHDRALDVSGAAILAGLLPKAEVEVMPNIGHVPMMEAPGRCARRYRQFRSSLIA